MLLVKNGKPPTPMASFWGIGTRSSGRIGVGPPAGLISGWFIGSGTAGRLSVLAGRGLSPAGLRRK